MEMRQLELDLWQSLDVAVRYPETANVQRLCDALEGAIAAHPLQEQLQIAGELLRQISEVYAARAAWLMDGWEYRHNPQEPIVALDDDANFFAQSLSLDLDDLFEEPEAVMYPSERRSRSVPQGTIVGELDKELLLTALDHQLANHPEMTEAEAFEAAIAVAHGEDVSEWVGAIDRVLKEPEQEQTLLGLQEQLKMPWVEIWLAALLGGYRVEQRGAFYQRETIWVGGRFVQNMERDRVHPVK
jgi:hypothetical protein